MLAIRLQRTGRSGHAQYRMIVQDAHRSPTSGKVVASLGNYDPHTKSVNINTEQANFYLTNGAQPSPRVANILANQGIKLPDWVQMKLPKQRKIKNTDKLRKNRPVESETSVESETTAETEVVEDTVSEVSTEAETVKSAKE